MSLITKEEAKRKYQMYLDAEEAVLVLGKSYTLDDGIEVTKVDIEKIHRGLNYWERKYHALNGARRTYQAIPCDY